MRVGGDLNRLTQQWGYRFNPVQRKQFHRVIAAGGDGSGYCFRCQSDREPFSEA